MGGLRAKRGIAALLAASVISSGLAAAPAAAEVPGPGAQLAEGLDSFVHALARAGASELLMEPLPMSVRSIADVLSINPVLVGSLRATLAEQVLQDPSFTDLDEAIDGADADVAGASASFDATITPAVEGEGATVQLDIAISTQQDVPVAYRDAQIVDENGAVVENPAAVIAAEPEAIINEDVIISLAGDATQSVSVTAELEASVTFAFDPAAPLTSRLRVIDPLPTIAVTVTGEADDLVLEGAYGFADLTTAGQVDYALSITAQAVDPDGTDGLHRSEWETTLPEELFPLARRDVPDTSDIDVALTFDSPQVSGDEDGTLTWEKVDASTGVGSPTRVVSAPLELFRNVTAADALVATTQLATTIGSLQEQGDVELPFTDSMLSRSFSPATAFHEVVAELAAADIRCGHADTSPPEGDEETGGTWFCQAYTDEDPDPGSVQWELVGDGQLSGGEADTTVGASPTRNVTVAGSQDRPDVRVTWTVTDADGATRTLSARTRFRTAGELETALAEGLESHLPDGASVEVSLGEWDGRDTNTTADDTIEYEISISADPSATDDARLAIGDAARAASGLSGVHATSDEDAEMSVDLDDVTLDLVFGVSLSNDLAAIAPDDQDSRSDRFYVRPTDEDGVALRIGDVTAGPTVETPVHTGQVGFLGVDVAIDGLDVTKTDADADAVVVSLVAPDGDAAGTNTIGNGARLLRHLTQRPDLHSDAAFNLQTSGTFSVTPAGDLEGVVPEGGRTIGVAWSPLEPDSRPAFAPSESFLVDLRPFDISPTVTGFATDGTEEGTLQDDDDDPQTPHIAVGTFLEDTAQDFTRAFGFEVTPSEDLEDPAEIAERSQVAGTLLNITTGGSCELFEVVTPTRIECVDGLVGGVARDPQRGDTQIEQGGDNAGSATIDNSWHPGDRYEVAGDATSLGRILIEGAGDLANDLEQNEALDARIPIVGVEARDLVPQLADLLDDTLVPILERIAESHVDATTGQPDAITTLQQLQAAFDDAGVDVQLGVEALATPLADDLVPHLVLRIGSLDHADTVPLADLETELSARALRLHLPDPAPTEVPEASVSSSVQVDLGVPLSAQISPQRLLVLATTGVRSASLTFDETQLDLTGTYGPLRIRAGVNAVMTGTAENPTGTHDAIEGTISGVPTISGTATGGSTTTLTDSAKDFIALGLVSGGTLARTAGGSCTVSTVAQHTLTCAEAMSSAVSSGDDYTYTSSASRAQLSTTDALGEVLAGDQVVSGGASCAISVVGEDYLTCTDPSASPFSTGAAFTIESPRRVRYTGDDLSATYGNGDRIINLTEDARCTVTAVTGSLITCSSGGLTGGKRWSDGDAWTLEKGDNGSALFVSGAGFDDMNVEGGTVENTTDGSSCTITSTTADTVICADGLSGGTKDRWANGDTFELGGVASAEIDASMTLLHEDGTTADPVLLDGAAEILGDPSDQPTFLEVLDLDLDGPDEPNRCGAPEPFGGDACFRLGLSSLAEDGTTTFLGVAEWAADVEGGNATGSAPGGATEAAAQAEISLPELATATALLSDVLGEQLDGYNVPTADALEGAWDPSSTLLPLVGADLSAAGGHDDGQSVEDALLALGGALSALEDLDPETIDTASELQAAIDGLLLDESLTGVGVGQIGTAAVTCYSGETAAVCGEDLKAEDDVRVAVTVGRGLDAAGTTPAKGCPGCSATETAAVPFDIGLPGLEFVAEDATVESRYAWKLDLGFGISRSHGPYLYTGGAEEFVLGAQVGLPDSVNSCDTAAKIADNDVPSNTPDTATKPSEFSSTRCFDAQLGLLEATVFDGNSDLAGHEAKDGSTDWSSGRSERTRLDLKTSVDLDAPGSSDRLDLIDLLDDEHESTTLVDADANVDLWFVTGKELTGGNLPQIQGGLHYAFDQDQMLSCEALAEALAFEEGSEEQTAFDEACTGDSRYPMVGDIEFTDLVMDLRTFFSDLLAPWVADVSGAIGVVRPVADYLLTPIPGLSQLAELTGQPPVTAFALMQEVSGNELTFLYNLLEFVQFADVIANGSAETVNDDDGIIGIGGTTVDEFGFPTSEIGGVGAITSSGGYKYDTSEARSVGPCGAQLPTIGGHRGGSVTKRFKPKDCQKSGTKYGKGGQKSKAFADASLTGFSRNSESENIKQLRSCPRGGATSGAGARPGTSRCSGKELARTISKTSGVELGAPGLWFPFLADANVMFGMLHGVDAQLVRLDLGTLKASAGLSIGFGPFMAGPVPIEIGIGGSIAASMRTMVGLDTLGLRTTGKLMDGFFIEDLDPYTQYDVYELQVVFTISVYAAVSIRFIKAGLEGEIELGIGANLQDPDGDGRVRPDELTMYGGDWWCAFLLEGYISFVARVFVELDFKLWSKRWAYDLFRKSWLLFQIQCEPDPPALAVEVDSSNAAAISEELTTAAGATVTVAAGDLVLNAGPRADDRNVDEDETEETFTLRQMEPTGAGSAACPPSTDTNGDGDYSNDSCPPPPVCPGASATSCTGVLIDAFGLSQEYRVGSGGRVVAVTEGGADFVSLLEGSGGDEAVTHPFVLPSLIHLGGDQDGFTGGDGPDVVYGGADRDVLEGAGGADHLDGGDGADSLKGEAGNDLIDGGAGDDRVAGGPGADVLFGRGDNDSLTGGPGLAPDLADRIARLKFPQDENETEAAWESRVQTVVTRVADSGDTIVGGAGSDEITGQVGDDLLVGDDLDGYVGGQDLTLVGKAGDATMTAALCAAPASSGAADHIEGATGDDAIVGGLGNDSLMGGRGNDLICGMGGHDELQGDDESPRIPGGADDLRGGDDDDRLLGRGGDDQADGGPGADLVEGGIGNDRLAGGPGSDVVIGDLGHDVVLGDAGTMATGDPIQDDADAAARVTLAEGSDAAGTGTVRCAVLIAVLDGELDMDGDGITGGDTDDDGRATGVPVVDGALDIDRSGAIDAADSGILTPYVVAAGRVDVNGDGTADDADDGSAPFVLHVGDGDADCLLGGDGDDGLFGGPGPDFLLGDDDQDYVAGNGGDDEGRGGDDDDVIRGGPHDDTLYGDGDEDDIHGDAGGDTIFGGSGTDHLEGNAGSDTIAGEGAPDVVIGGSSAADAADEGDTLDGNVGNDIVIGDNGTATNDGTPQLADVTLHDVPTGGTAPVAGEYGDDTIIGGAGIDWAFGGSGADTIQGDGPGVSNALSGADHLEGGSGSDTIAGQQRADHLIGGSSMATVSDAGDTITGGAGADSIVGDNGTVQTAGIVLHDLPLVGSPYPTGVAGADTIWGGDGAAGAGTDLADVIYGQSGDDRLHGQLGDDYLEGNQGADTIYGEEGSDAVIGGSGHDQGGTAFAERLLNNVDDALGDTLYGGAGGDQLLGDNADVDRPASGARTVALQNVPFLSAAAPSASLSGGDTIWGGDGATSTTGADTDDLIYGQSGADQIGGEAGDDTIEGGAGSDTIGGDAGHDDITGGSGKDQGGTGAVERLLAGVRDDADVISGDAGSDLIAGDNAKTWRIEGHHLIQLHDLPLASAALPGPDLAGGDTLAGGPDSDEIYGQSGDDTIGGGSADDRIEGGDGADTIRGEGGDDDAVGGSGHDDGGTLGAMRELANIEDDGDTISGGAGTDHLAGDNASQVRVTEGDAVERRTKLHDIPFVGSVAPDLDVSGDDALFGDDRTGDTSTGDPGPDLLFGQSGNDILSGQAGDDDLQGNDGADVLSGNEGGDDLVGGSSRDHGGVNGTLRKLANVRDEEVVGIGDTLHGDDEIGSSGGADLGDVLAGDNAYITTTAASDPNRPGTRVRAVELFDVAVAGGYTPDGATAGPDLLSGDANRDLLFGQGEADTLHGDADDDHLEGNHGSDTLHGDADRDDIIGGSSVNPGGLVGSMVGGGAFPAATDVADGSDLIYGDGAEGITPDPVDNLPDVLTHTGNSGEDAILGDNGRIARTVTGGVWAVHAAPYSTLLKRDLQVSDALERAGAWADDRIWAGEGHDEVHGQLGSDTIHGNEGDDTIMGDLGRFGVEVVAAGDPRTTRIAADGDFISEVVFRPYTLFRLTDLYRATTDGGNDVITGGAGNDVVHAGFGQDTVNGHGDILRTDVPDDPTTPGSDDPDELALAALDADCDADLDTVVPSFTANGPLGQLACDEDQLFGDDGDDRMWGGPGHDHLFGGHNPGLGTLGEHLDVVYPGFDPFFHGNVDVDFKGVDYIFGGYGQDALQADRSAPSPNGLDKLLDAAGAYNAYFVCEGAYGGNSVVRVLSPEMLTFLRNLATADGARDVGTPTSSGFRELALIDRNDIPHNTNPVHPETPGNFICGDAPG